MKRSTALLAAAITLLLLLFIPIGAWAGGSASWGGPGVIRAGDTIHLTFYAGGGIYGGNGTVSFDASQLTLQGYSGALSSPWAVEFSGNHFVFYDNSMTSPIQDARAIFTATFVVNAGLAPSTQVTVTASGVTLSDGSSDMGAGSPQYSKTIAEPLSGNANLKSLTVSNAQITPAFSPGVTSYSASVPFPTSSLQVSAVSEHPGATVNIGNTGLTPGATTAVSVTVTAENGTVKTYTIRVARAQDPNYVPSSDCALASLSVEGFLLSPVFDPEKTAYAVYLPYETENLSLLAQAHDAKAKLTMPQNTALPEGETVLDILCKAENGNERIYHVTVFRAPPFTGTDPTPTPSPSPTPSPKPVPSPSPQPETPPPPTPSPTLYPQDHLVRALGDYGWALAALLLLFLAGGVLIGVKFKSEKHRHDNI